MNCPRFYVIVLKENEWNLTKVSWQANSERENKSTRSWENRDTWRGARFIYKGLNTLKALNALKALNRLNRKSDKTVRYGPIRRGRKKVIKRRDTDQSGEGEIKVLRPAPEGGEKRGNKTKKNLRYRINSIPSGITYRLDILMLVVNSYGPKFIYNHLNELCSNFISTIWF